MTVLGLDLTAISRGRSGISDYRVSCGLAWGLSQVGWGGRYAVALNDTLDSQGLGLAPLQSVAVARPRARAIWNSVAFRRAFSALGPEDVALYFHFPPWRAGHRCLTYVPDIIPLRSPGAFGPCARAYYRLQPILIRRAGSAVITISAAERAAIVDAGYAAPERVHTMRLGLDTPWSRVVAGSVDVQADRIGLAPEFCLVVGRLDRRKNIERLLAAWSMLSSPPELWFVGPSEDVGIETQIVRSLNSRYLGVVSDTELERLYAQCLLVVNPSLDEGFGLPVAEALARGKRVAMSSIPSFEEIAALVDHGAYPFDPRSPESIAHAIEAALNGMPPAAADVERLADEHSWANAARDLLRAVEAEGNAR